MREEQYGVISIHQHSAIFQALGCVVDKNHKKERTKNGTLGYTECYRLFFILCMIVGDKLLLVEQITAYPVKFVAGDTVVGELGLKTRIVNHSVKIFTKINVKGTSTAFSVHVFADMVV